MGKSVESFSIEPEYRKSNGQYVQDIDRDDLPLGFQPITRSLVTIPAGQVGGNHVHSREEGFIAIGSGLEIHWQDEAGEPHSEAMNPDGQLMLFVVRSMVPHAIKNRGEHDAVLLEYASQTMTDSSYEKRVIIPE